MQSGNIVRRRGILAAAVAAVPFFAAVKPADAITITLVYDAAGSVEPASDPTGAQLQTIMNHVDSFYSDVFETAHNITITYRYGAQPGGILAAHTLNTQGGVPNRELTGTIVFSNTVNWFFDATPADNSEYNMSQTLWRDLSVAQRNDLYNNDNLANVPATFEAGFTGAGNGSDPNTAGATDALSVAFHETGHALGMSASNTSTDAETLGDNDYDFDAVNVFGIALAAEIADGGNNAHLDASGPALMNPSIGTNVRRLPSHTDLFSMARVHQYTDLDVPRREFYGGTNWNNAANWAGNAVPGAADETYVRASGPNGEFRTAGLTADGDAGVLIVSETSNVDTNAFTLDVFDSAIIDGLDSDIIVDPGGTLNLFTNGTLTIRNQAQLFMNGGNVVAGTVANTANIFGNGTISFDDTLINSGSIQVSGGSLTISATGASGDIDLDGFNSGTIIIIGEPGDVNVTAANSDLTVNGPLNDAFNGAMTIGNSNSVTMNDAWTLGGNTGTIVLTTDGQLNLNGGTTSATAAVLNGAIVTINGDVNVGTNNYGIINAATAFVGGEIHIQSNGTLDLEGSNSFNGGTYDGAGTIKFDGNTTIIGDTTMDIANVDLDGDVISDTFTVNNGVTFTINGNITDDYDASLFVNGTLNVNGPSWGLFTGSLTLGSGTIGGTAGFRNNSSGVLTVGTGASVIATTSNFGGSASQIINGTLRLQGNSVINGGTWSGTGILALDDQSTTFTGNTTLNMATFDMDGLIAGTGSINVNSGVTVTVNSSISDAFDGTLNVNSGTFDLNTGTLVVNGGGVVNITDTGAGTATLIAPGVTNSAAATINFNGGASNGFGGGGEGVGPGPEAVTGGGRLNAGTFVNNGRINVSTNSGGFISGASTFNAGGSVVVNAGGQLVIDGTSNFAGGSFSGTGILTQDADVTVSANTTIGVTTFDWDGDFFGNTTVNSGVMLTINSATVENDLPANNGHDSTVTLNSGSVTVNTAAPWIKAGNLILANTGGGVPNVLGQSMISTGTISTTGATQMSAELINGGGTLVTNLGSTHTSVGGFRTNVLNTFTKSGLGQWTVTGPQSHVANSVLNITAGNVNFNSDAGAGGANLRVNHSGLNFNMNTSQRLARLDIGAGATATANAAGNANIVRLNVLNIAGGANPTGTLNLADETMIYDYTGATPIIAVRDWLLSGYNGNTWTGDGIRSGFAALDPANRALGYVEATNIGSPATFAGESIDGTTIIVRATLPGDTNLDRTVNITDFAILASNFNTPQFWAGGDFDYNFLVNISDFAILASNFNEVIPADLPRGGNVPEPAAASVLVLGAGLVARRRRNR